MKTQRLVLTLLAVTFALAPQSPRTASAEGQRGRYAAKLMSPNAGAVLLPGQVVRVEWMVIFPSVDLTKCETEVFLSVDGGKTFTFVTNVHNPHVQYFDWIVPRSPTKAAILDIRFGCLGLFPETSSPQVQSTFEISSMD